MTDTPALDRILDTCKKISDRSAAREYASAMAIGVATDDPGGDDPDGTVIIYEGMVIHMSLSDGYTALPADEATAVVSGLLHFAYFQWREDFARLLDYAQSVLDEYGDAPGSDFLRDDMRRNDPLADD